MAAHEISSTLSTSPPARAAVFPAQSALAAWRALFWLEIKRMARGWRWRGLLIVAAVGAFWWRRDGFGEGRPIFFPLGDVGLAGFSALFGAGAAVLGADALSQAQRARALRLLDARPASDAGVALARWLAAAILLALAGAAVLLEIVGLRAWIEQPAAQEPFAALMAFWWIPLIVVGVALGQACRSFVRNDAAALAAALILLLVFGLFLWRLANPISFFYNYAPAVGIVIPSMDLLRDAGFSLVLALGIVGVGALAQRHRMPRSPISPEPPYRRKPLPTFRAPVWPFRQFLFTDAATRAAAIVLFAAALAVQIPWSREWRFLQSLNAEWPVTPPPLPPELAMRPFPRWNLPRLDAQIGAKPGDPWRFTFSAVNSTTESLSWGAVALSPVWDKPQFTSPTLVAVQPGPDPDSWVFPFAPPLDPGTTRTLSLEVRPRPGSERMHRWARHPRYSNVGRLGAWWPRPAGFDLMNRRMVVSAQPMQYLLRIPAGPSSSSGSSVIPAVAGADVERRGGAWEARSLFAQSRISLVLAPYAVAEQNTDGLDLRLLVFERHQEIADTMLGTWNKRQMRLRRVFGVPPAPFVFHEAAAGGLGPDPLAISSEQFDLLDDHQYDPEVHENQLFNEMNTVFPPVQMAILRLWSEAALGMAAEPYLLRDSLLEYLHEYALAGGLEPSNPWERNRPAPAKPLVPWRGPGRGSLPFDFRDVDRMTLRRPWDESTLMSESSRKLSERRAKSFHHAIRFALGDENYREFLQNLFARRSAVPFTLDEYLALAQQHSSRPLKPIADQILGSARLPTLRARQAFLYRDQDPNTRELFYTTEVVVANEGEGTWPVPVVLSLEDGLVERIVVLGPGEKQTLTFKTRSRPQVLAMDPFGWLPQVPPFKPKSKTQEHSKIFLKNIIDRTG